MSDLASALRRANFDDRSLARGESIRARATFILDTMGCRAGSRRGAFETVGKADTYILKGALKETPRKEFF